MNQAWSSWIRRNRAAMESDGTRFEVLFAEKVLSGIGELDPTTVSTQTAFKDLEGGRRRIDFTVQDGKNVRIAIEIDGWDKDGSGTGPSRQSFTDWSLREISLVAGGWSVLRFANSLVAHKPELCRESLELRLKMEREQAKAIEAGTKRGKELDQMQRDVVQAAKGANVKDPAAIDQVEKIERARRAEQALDLDKGERERFAQTEAQLDQAMNELNTERELRKSTEGENKKMKIMGVAVLAVCVVLAIVLLGNGEGEPPTVALCDEAVPAQELTGEQVGEVVTAEGFVAATARNSGSGPSVYLNLGADYPDQDLAVVIWKDDVTNWGASPEDKYDNRRIAVKGELESYNGSLEIVANAPNDIEVCE